MTTRDLNKKILCMLLAIMGTHGLVGCSMDESADEEVSQDSDFLGESDNGAGASEEDGVAAADETGGEDGDSKSAKNDDELDNESSSAANDGADDEFADDETKTAENTGEKDLDRELASGDDEFDKEFSEDNSANTNEKAVAANSDDSLEDLDESAKSSDFQASDAPPVENTVDVPEPSSPDQIASQEPPPADTTADTTTDTTTDSFAGTDGTADPLLTEDTSSSESQSASASGPRPLQKIVSQPYTKNGRLLNAVYIGRPGDSVDTVSQKIFGSNKQEEIIKDNPWLADGIKPGEKLYYNSPNRPADNTMMVSYFEDKNLAPQSYTAQDGDNIRIVSQKLLGFPEAWKEIWATNQNVESKDELAPGTELKFWKDDTSVGAPSLAEANGLPQQLPDLAQTDSGFSNQGIPAPNPVSNDLSGSTDLAAPTDLASSGLQNDPLNPQDAFAAPGLGAGGGTSAGSQASADAPAPVDLNGPQVAMENPASESKDMSSANPPSESSNQNMIFIGIAVLAVAGFAAMKLKGKKSSGPVNMEYTQV